MPYRNVVQSNVWNRMLARRRQIAELPKHDSNAETESIWIPPDVLSRNGKGSSPGDLPRHTWRPNSGVSSR